MGNMFKSWKQILLLLLLILQADRDSLTFWTGSRCGQVKVRGGFQRGTLLLLEFLTFSERCSIRKEHRPPQSTRPSSFTASRSRMRPQCSWVTTTLSNRRPYSSSEPWLTAERAERMNSALDKERDEPETSCSKTHSKHVCTFLTGPGGGAGRALVY